MADMKSEREVSKEGSKYIGFAEAFHDLSKELAGAYSVSPDIYSQSASTSRFEKGISVNQAKEFLSHVEYDEGKAKSIIETFAKTHKPIQFYLGKDTPISLGVNIGSEELLSLGPDSKANGRSRTIAALTQRAARLESLLSPNGIPEVYATAQTQTKKALKLVEKAAGLAYDWHPSWGVLNTDNALNEAKGQITRKKVAQASMVGILALAGCNMPATPIPTRTSSWEGNTPTTTEVVPTMTETFIPTQTPEPSKTPTLEPSATSTVIETETTENPIIYNDSFEKYENISQNELASIVEQSKRLYQPGRGQFAPLGFDEPHTVLEDRYPDTYSVKTWGVLLETPQLETLILPNWEDATKESQRYDLYTAPVVFQAGDGSYFVAKVIFAGIGTRSSRAFYGNQEISLSAANKATTMPTEDLMEIIEPGVQHEIRLVLSLSPNYWVTDAENESQDGLIRSWISLNRQYAESTKQVIDSIRLGERPVGSPVLVMCQEVMLNQKEP